MADGKEENETLLKSVKTRLSLKSLRQILFENSFRHVAYSLSTEHTGLKKLNLKSKYQKINV